MHCSLSFKTASNKYDSLRVGNAKPDPVFHHFDSGLPQIIQVVDRDWALFHNHGDQKWLWKFWKPPCVGRQPVHQGIAASKDDCCIVRWRCDLNTASWNPLGRKPLKLPQGDWLLVSNICVTQFHLMGTFQWQLNPEPSEVWPLLLNTPIFHNKMFVSIPSH